MWKRVVHWAQPAIFVLACVLIVLLLASHWEELRSYPWTLDGRWLLLSLAALLASWAMEVGIWRDLLRLLGGWLSYGAAVRIWFLSAIVRYIPGNIWQPLSMTLYGQQYGIRPEATVMSIALYQAVILLSAAVIAALYVLVTGNLGLLTPWLQAVLPALVLLMALPAAVFLLRPMWLIAILNWALHKIGRRRLDAQLSSGRLFALLAVATLNWLLWGASFAALTFALGAYSQDQALQLAPHLVVAYPIAYAAGFVSLITPSGFGVREGVFVILLAPLMDPAVVAVAALAMRVVTLVGEFILALISAVWGRSAGTSAAVGAPQEAPTPMALPREG